MNPSKAAELMRIYIAENWRGMTPDDVQAHTEAIGALMAIEFWGLTGLYNLLMGARRAKNMLIRGGDFIGCKTNDPQ
jgi:hypothetical protein